MRYRKLDALGDYTFGAGQADFWRDVPDAVAQAIETRLALYLGEWFLDSAEGMDWRGQVLGTGTVGLYDLAIQERILGTQGVEELISYASQKNGDTRRLDVQADVQTIYGVATVDIGTPDPALNPANDDDLLGLDGAYLTGTDQQFLLGPRLPSGWAALLQALASGATLTQALG